MPWSGLYKCCICWGRGRCCFCLDLCSGLLGLGWLSSLLFLVGSGILAKSMTSSFWVFTAWITSPLSDDWAWRALKIKMYFMVVLKFINRALLVLSYYLSLRLAWKLSVFWSSGVLRFRILFGSGNKEPWIEDFRGFSRFSPPAKKEFREIFTKSAPSLALLGWKRNHICYNFFMSS